MSSVVSTAVNNNGAIFIGPLCTGDEYLDSVGFRMICDAGAAASAGYSMLYNVTGNIVFRASTADAYVLFDMTNYMKLESGAIINLTSIPEGL